MKNEIEKAAFDYINSDVVKAENMQLAFGDFINGAEWMLEKSISWFYKNAHKLKYWDDKGYLLIYTLMEDYKKAMEG